EVQVRDGLARPEQAAHQPQLGVERVEVLSGGFLVTRTDLVAGAVVADAPAEGDVEVEAERLVRAVGAFQDGLPVVGGAESVVEAVRARVRRVARRAAPESLDQLVVDLDLARADDRARRSPGTGRRAAVAGRRRAGAGRRYAGRRA